jgi:hypothetical protein
VLGALVGRTWLAAVPNDGLQLAIQQAVQTLVSTRLMDLAANADASPAVRAEASEALRQIRSAVEAGKAGAGTGLAHRHAAVEEITRFLGRPDSTERRTPQLPTPAGEPIGGR